MTPAEIRAWRLAHRLTQGQLATLLGVNRIAETDWERGKYAPAPYLPLALEALDARLERALAVIEAGVPPRVERRRGRPPGSISLPKATTGS